MKSNIQICLILLIPFFAFTQIYIADKFYVQFTDKNDSPFSIENPEVFLSQRAINRRQNQGLGFDHYDLPVNPQYLQGVAATGVQMLNPTKWLNGVTIETLDTQIISSIESLPFVNGIFPVSYVEEDTSGFVKPEFKNESYFFDIPQKNQTNNRDLVYDYGGGMHQISMLRGNEFHEMGYRGEGMVIAVLDAGFANADTLPLFDSLWNEERILGTWDFVTNSEVSFHGHYHGTMVLSCMGANIPGQFIGTAPEASYWLLRSEYSPSEFVIEEYNWVSAAEFADSVGADIINSSLGYHDFDAPGINPVYEDMDGDTRPTTIGADFAASRGILVVNSAGNQGNDNLWYWLTAPSDADSTMCVGAVDSIESIAGFSSFGPSSDGRVKPNLVAMGRRTTVANPWSDGIIQSNGTSFSSPIMAGISAILWQANPDKNNMDILSALEQSSDRYDNPDERYGHGVPDVVLAHEILNPVRINEISNGGIIVFPNPADDFVQIEFTKHLDHSNLMVKISDLIGKQTLKSKMNLNGNELISVATFQPGIYLLSIESQGVIITTEKLVIQ